MAYLTLVQNTAFETNQSPDMKGRETTVIALQTPQKSKASPYRQYKGASIWKRDHENRK